MINMQEYDISEAFRRIENELIESMTRNMNRHKVKEVEENKQWAMWQAEQLKALDAYKARNAKKYKGSFSEINSSIAPLLAEARRSGNMDQEAAILEAIGKGWKPTKGAGDITGAFFRINDQKINALADATVNDMQKAETAILRRANDAYRKTIFDAQMYAASGAGTYQKAVDMATKDFLSAGIQCVQYKNGSMHSLSDYADMAIRTASKRAYLTGEGEKRQEWGCHLVIMNKRGNPCPKCLPFVGKILIDDVWSGGSRADGDYPLMSAAVAAGLYHPRCKDSHTTYFPGINRPPEEQISKKDIEQIREQVKEEQREQYISRQRNKYHRLSMYSLDAENKKEYRIRENELSPKKPTEGKYGVNWPVVSENSYKNKFLQLSEDDKILDAIYTRSKWMLNNRDGLKTEEMYAISMKTGEEIARITDQNIEFGVARSTQFQNQLDEADRKKEKILLLHNHPRGMPPSLSDLNALVRNKYVTGITIGHDGSIYYYTKPKKLISTADFEIAMRKYSRYTDITGMEKALEELSRTYEFKFEKL